MAQERDQSGRRDARDEARRCPRCERLLAVRERRGGDGLTLVWQCACGWAAARTVSRELAFRQSRDMTGLAALRAEPAPRGVLFGSRADVPASTTKVATKPEES
jgi:hypothetical protein